MHRGLLYRVLNRVSQAAVDYQYCRPQYVRAPSNATQCDTSRKGRLLTESPHEVPRRHANICKTASEGKVMAYVVAKQKPIRQLH